MISSIRAFGILLHTGRNLKAQGLHRHKRRALLLAMKTILQSYPISVEGTTLRQGNFWPIH